MTNSSLATVAAAIPGQGGRLGGCLSRVLAQRWPGRSKASAILSLPVVGPMSDATVDLHLFQNWSHPHLHLSSSNYSNIQPPGSCQPWPYEYEVGYGALNPKDYEYYVRASA